MTDREQYWRLQPLLEARIQLRYATILHEETDNLDDAEEALSKGVRYPFHKIFAGY